MSIDEILHDFAVNLHPYATGKGQASDYDKYKSQALTAIYEIGLECIGADEPTEPYSVTELGNSARNDLRADQRKAWAKACGVAE